MRCLVTGGAGFIGSHLSERLLASGHEVLAIDDLSTGSMENVMGFRFHPRYEFHGDSIFNRRLMAELVDLVDIVFHLAAAVGVRRIVDYPVQTIETNVGGTEIVFELASKKRRRLLIASTSEVYGKSNKLPFSETDDLVLGSTYNNRWAYACSKAIDEFLALAYFREHKLPVTILRLFNTVGPRQTGQYGMVVPTFVRQALLGEEISIADLARRVTEMTESSSKIRYVPYTEAYGPGFEDMQRRIPDISKAQSWLNYRPKYGLDDILRDVIAFERHQIGRKKAVFVATDSQ